jgi:hypothetical protein
MNRMAGSPRLTMATRRKSVRMDLLDDGSAAGGDPVF